MARGYFLPTIGSVLTVALAASAADQPIIQPSMSLHLDSGNYVPERAARMGVGGWARVRCLVGPDSHATNCIVVGEFPAQYDFGRAALRIIEQAQFAPISPGEPIVGRIIIEKFGFGSSSKSSLGSAAEQEWSSEPSITEIARARPKTAEEFGMADIACSTVRIDGSLQNCTVQNESPAGEGFGAAALTLAEKYRCRDPGAPTWKVSFFVNWIEPGSTVVPPGWQIDLRSSPPRSQAIVTLENPSQPGGIVRPKSEIFAQAPTQSQIDSVRPNGASGRASVFLSCKISSSGALERCAGTSYQTTDPRYVAAAVSLLPFFRLSPNELSAIQAKPQAVYHINWEPRA